MTGVLIHDNIQSFKAENEAIIYVFVFILLEIF